MGSKRVGHDCMTKHRTTYMLRFCLYCFCCSIAQSCSTLCNPMDCSTPCLSVLHHLLEFVQVHVHCIDDAVQPSHLMIPSSPSALNILLPLLLLTYLYFFQLFSLFLNDPHTSFTLHLEKWIDCLSQNYNLWKKSRMLWDKMFYLIYSKGQLKDSINSNTENVTASFRKKTPSVLVSRNLS